MSNGFKEYIEEMKREKEYILKCEDFKEIMKLIRGNFFTHEPVYCIYKDGEYLIESWILTFGDDEEIVIRHEFAVENTKYDYWYKDIHYVKTLLESEGKNDETVSN